MKFLNFLQLLKRVFRPNCLGKHFSENQVKFSINRKVFPLINFSNNKQTYKSFQV
jgi:hypothetical protein